MDTLKIIANTFGITVDDFVKRDIRKLRETPDLTFGFDPKPQYYGNASEPTETKEIDPFDIPINRLPNNEVLDRTPYNSSNFRTENIEETTPSIGDLMKKFLGNTPSNEEKHTEIKPTERVSQSVTLKPSFEREQTISPVTNQHSYPTQNHSQNPTNQALNQNIQLVKRYQFNEYLIKNSDFNFLKTLIQFNIPTLPIGDFRAFEAGEDFSFEGALLIGSLVKNWQEILDGKNYVLVTKSNGIIYRRVYNQVKIKGTLLLSSDNNRFPSAEISFTDVIETWEIKAFVSHILPEPTTPYNKLGNLVDEMKFELERIKK